MKRWILLAVLIAAFSVVYQWTSNSSSNTELKREDLDMDVVKPNIGKATLEPGRVVELQLPHGKIEFVLFEKDCPVTTKRISELVTAKSYDGVKFTRVVDWVVQSADAKKTVSEIDVEVLDRIKNITGAVGMARKNRYKTNVSAFYILKSPQPHLDHEYTVFGQVIKGQDVVNKIKLNDVIKSATIRPFAPEDKPLLDKALKTKTSGKSAE